MKTKIRQEILKKRDSMTPGIRGRKDMAIKEMLFSLPEFISAGTVLFYASFRSEVNTFEMIQESLKKGKRVILPKVDKENRRLALYEIERLSELFPGFMGIPEPPKTEGRMRSVDMADLVIMPGAAFDLSGNRLGYGAGYYDMLLGERAKEMPLVALAYEEQMVEWIPAEEHDVKVDMIITDKRIIRTS